MEVSALSISSSFIPAVVLLITVPVGPRARVGGHPSALVPGILCGYSPWWLSEVQGLLPPAQEGSLEFWGKEGPGACKFLNECFGVGHLAAGKTLPGQGEHKHGWKMSAPASSRAFAHHFSAGLMI